jgi:hypothetical protein
MSPSGGGKTKKKLRSAFAACANTKGRDIHRGLLLFSVRARGLEPPLSCENKNLNLARLPIPPCPLD